MAEKVLAAAVLVVAVVFWWPILNGSVPYWYGAPYSLITFFGVRWALQVFSEKSSG